jgi:acyl CoA:acetate/3-ketoacid CoA transferase alpha subunit/acyl CoA:acetate/3-ketoacid CoA transferase beta subunit
MTGAEHGASKVVSLAEAVRRTVRPGDTLVFAFTHNRSHAAAFEVARQFRDTGALTLVATGLLEYASILVSAGAIGRLESAFAGGTYPAPSPSRILQQALQDLAGSDPDWTNLTMTLRLMAGAFGWPFVPTHSLAGSGLWKDRARALVEDPFTGTKVPVIAALVPDVAFLHVPLADTLGNAIVHSPDAEDSWGAKAARRLVVTAERIVSPEAFRAIGPRRGIPAQKVDAVVEAPYGAHPQGQFVWNSEEGVASYAEDYAFRQELRRLVRDPAAMRAWVEEWVFGTDHAGYLARLGKPRLAALEEAALRPVPAAASHADAPASPEEIAAVLAMRIAEQEVTEGRVTSLFAGIGLAHLAAWAAETRCRARGLNVDLIAETGMIGFLPMPGDPYLFNRPNAAASRFHASFVETLGALAGPRAQGCLAMLAAAQIDRAGNINSSRAGNGTFIVGSGGANDLAAGAASVLVVMPLKPGRYAEALPFVTSPVRHLRAVATDLCLLERGADGALAITALVCTPGAEAATLAEIAARCGGPLPLAGTPIRLDPPSPADIAALRQFDPARAILT